MKLPNKMSQRCTPDTDRNRILRPYERPAISVRRIASIVNRLTVGDNPDNVAGGRTKLSPGGLGSSG